MNCCGAGKRFQVRKGNFVQCQNCGNSERVDAANERLTALANRKAISDDRDPAEIRAALANGTRKAPYIPD